MSRNNSIIVIFAISMLIVAAIGTSIAISVTNNKDTPTPGPEPEPEPGVVTKEECVAVALASYEEAHANYVAALEKYENAGSATSKQECAVAVDAATAQMYSALNKTMKTLNDDNVLMNDLIGYQSNGTSIKGLYDNVGNYNGVIADTAKSFQEAVALGMFQQPDLATSLSALMEKLAIQQDKLSTWNDATLNGHMTALKNVYDKYALSTSQIVAIFEQIKSEVDNSKKALDSNDIDTVIQINNNIAAQYSQVLEIASNLAVLVADFAKACDISVYTDGIKALEVMDSICSQINDALNGAGCSDEEKAVFDKLILECSALVSNINEVSKTEQDVKDTITGSATKIAADVAICAEISKISGSINNDISKAVVPLDGSEAVIGANLVKLAAMSLATEQAAEAASNATTVEEAAEAAEMAYEMASQSDAVSEEIDAELQTLQSLINDVNASLADAELEIEAMEALTETMSDAGKKALADDEKNTNVPAFDTLSGDDEDVDENQSADLDDGNFDENGDANVDENGASDVDEDGASDVDENGDANVDVPLDENGVPLDENGVADFCGYSDCVAVACASFE